MSDGIYITLDDNDDNLDARTLIVAVQLFLGLLHDLDIAISSESRGGVQWKVSTLSKSSPARLGFIGYSRRGKENHSTEIERRCIRGLKILAERAERDPYYSDQALYKAGNLARLRQRHLLSRITIGSPAEGEIVIGPAIAEHVDELISEVEESEGSIVGNLDSISVHNGNQFRVWDDNTGKVVTCRFPEPLLQTAKEYLKQRVLVYGTLRRNVLGGIGSISVEGIDNYPTDEQLPTIEQMSGSIPNITGGLSLQEYMRLLRDEER